MNIQHELNNHPYFLRSEKTSTADHDSEEEQLYSAIYHIGTYQGVYRRFARNCIRTLIQKMDVDPFVRYIYLHGSQHDSLVEAGEVELFRLYIARVTQLGKFTCLNFQRTSKIIAKLSPQVQKSIAQIVCDFIPLDTQLNCELIALCSEHSFFTKCYDTYNTCRQSREFANFQTWTMGWDIKGSSFQHNVPIPRYHTFVITAEWISTDLEYGVVSICEQRIEGYRGKNSLNVTKLINPPSNIRVCAENNKYVIFTNILPLNPGTSGRLGVTVKLIPLAHTTCEVSFYCKPSLLSTLRHKLSYRYLMSITGTTITLWINSKMSLRMKLVKEPISNCIHFYDPNDPYDVPMLGTDSISITCEPPFRSSIEWQLIHEQLWCLKEMDGATRPYLDAHTIHTGPKNLQQWFKMLDDHTFLCCPVKDTE